MLRWATGPTLKRRNPACQAPLASLLLDVEGTAGVPGDGAPAHRRLRGRCLMIVRHILIAASAEQCQGQASQPPGGPKGADGPAGPRQHRFRLTTTRQPRTRRAAPRPSAVRERTRLPPPGCMLRRAPANATAAGASQATSYALAPVLAETPLTATLPPRARGGTPMRTLVFDGPLPLTTETEWTPLEAGEEPSRSAALICRCCPDPASSTIVGRRHVAWETESVGPIGTLHLPGFTTRLV